MLAFPLFQNRQTGARTINRPITILINLLHHDLQLLITQLLAKALHHLRDLIAIDGAAAVLVEDFEGGEHFLLEVCGLGFYGHHLDEFLKSQVCQLTDQDTSGEGQEM